MGTRHALDWNRSICCCNRWLQLSAHRRRTHACCCALVANPGCDRQSKHSYQRWSACTTGAGTGPQRRCSARRIRQSKRHRASVSGRTTRCGTRGCRCAVDRGSSLAGAGRRSATRHHQYPIDAHQQRSTHCLGPAASTQVDRSTGATDRAHHRRHAASGRCVSTPTPCRQRHMGDLFGDAAASAALTRGSPAQTKVMSSATGVTR